MGSVEGWKHLIEIVPSKSNGITFDCGVTREMGRDPVEVCRYFGTRDRINHVHFRNVQVHQCRDEKYTEVFVDDGQVNMFAVMNELVRQKYPRLIFPEHPRGLDADRERPEFMSHYPGGGSYTGYLYNVAYARAMLGGPGVEPQPSYVLSTHCPNEVAPRCALKAKDFPMPGSPGAPDAGPPL